MQNRHSPIRLILLLSYYREIILWSRSANKDEYYRTTAYFNEHFSTFATNYTELKSLPFFFLVLHSEVTPLFHDFFIFPTLTTGT
jgi:hypothetical protein